MSEQKAYAWGSQLIVAAIFAVLGAGLLYWFVSFSERPERTHREPFQGVYSEEPLLAALTSNRLETFVKAIQEAGSRPGERWQGRYAGSPGFYRTEELIVEAFRAAGLAVTTQEFQVTVPVTEYCEILDETGRPLEGVTLYPFLPSGLEPTVLPPQGISGTLVATESVDMKHLNGCAPSNTIVLTYLDAAADWSALAGIGVPAVLVREDELVRRLRASPDLAGAWKDLASTTEVGFPRFLVRGPIEQAAGQAVTLRCKVTWQARTVRNVLGVLRADRPSREALVLNAFYDSNSLVPELAPGAEQTLSLAALLDYAQGFAPYRGKLSRDLIFVATAGHAQAMAGAIRLMEAIETFTRQQNDYRPVEERIREQERFLDYTRRAQGVLDELARDAARTNTPVLTRTRWLGEEAGFRTWFEAGLSVVTGENNLDFQERARMAKLAYQRAGSPIYREGFDPSPTRSTDEERKNPANTHPMLASYLRARRTVTDADNLMSTPLWNLAANTNLSSWQVVEKARVRFHELAAFHERQIRQLRDLAGLRDWFQPYEKTLTVNLELYSGGVKQKQDLSMLVGLKDPGSVVEPQSFELAAAISEKIPRVAGKPAWKLVSWGARDGAGGPGQPNPNGAGPFMESVAWHTCGRSAFTVMNYEFFPPKLCTPEDTPDGMSLGVVQAQVPVLGRALLAVAHGRVPFKSIPPTRDGITAVRGAVYASAGGSSLVPTHPVTIRTAAQILTGSSLPLSSRGVTLSPVVLTDPYGRYEYPIVLGMARWSVFSVNAARFDENGRLAYIKDSSVAAQGNYRNTDLSGSEVLAGVSQPPKPVNIPVFRCSRVALFDRGNPRTLKSFQGVSYLDRQGLSAPPRAYRTGYVDFMEPDFRFHVGFMDGAPGNKEILQYRAFMLNVDPQASTNLAGESELYGRGYLAEETPVLALPHLDAAASMLRTNEKRLELQKRFGMADEQMLAFHERAKEWLAQARAKLAAREPAQAVIAAGTSLAYAINNHPVIRDRISQAVIGILWYLALLVPFVFFAEKLLFGFTDIRRQILACGVIFVVVFALLRLFHPAFEMVRSSLMILLGFVISLLTVLVIVMVTSKFKQNIKELRSREGQVEGADINRAGVVGTAFMLGLNNMRRRKVRTGLTCVTLILITFVMICFTSVSTDLVNIEFPTGRSSWNGIMLRNPNYTPLADSELSSIRRIYGDRFPIATCRWLVPSLSVWSMGGLANPEVHVDREFRIGEIKNSKRIKLSGCIAMDWNETQFSGIDRHLLTTNGWFPRPPQTRAERLEASARGYKEKNYVILPDSAAAELGLTVEEVNTAHPVVTIRDAEYEVLGIMDSVQLSKTIGLDGRSIMPYDINSVQSMGTKGKDLVVPEDIGRLNPQQVLIVNQMPPAVSGEGVLTVSCSILFPRQPYRLEKSAPEQPPADYKEQRLTVLEYLERIGEPAFYAVDGVSFYGSRKRAKTFAGLLELLVPILIAALTVFNTMRGSVYERKDEIYVYNAVGVAPNHVFFIFMAEACVYAVVGALMGYILSQGTGRLLTALGMTGGLNMDYSSIETIYASLAIMAATLLSTVLPARDAARMASPADTTRWTIPEAQGDVMSFNLPFTFTAHDRIAVISYFYRWLDANGMGSSGSFYCSAPETAVRREAGGARGAEDVPVLATTIWLKPYDLGVSQRLEIALPTDPETGEYIARITITRLSGHVNTWQRRILPFLTTLRKQFLNWRVTSPADRTELFAEAKRMLEAGAPAKKES